MKVLVLLVFFGLPGHHVQTVVKFSGSATLKQCETMGEHVVANFHKNYPKYSVGYICGVSKVRGGVNS